MLAVGKAEKVLAQRSAGQYLHLANDQFLQSTENHTAVGEESFQYQCQEINCFKGEFSWSLRLEIILHLTGILQERT